MTLGGARQQLDLDVLGRQMYACIEELYPLCRSITGDGVRETLRRIGGRLPLTLHEVPTGVPVFDWTVPNEWNIRDAWVKSGSGERVVDFRKSNLHVVSYSVPVRARMALAELKERLHSLPESPDRIPYRTSYYRETWGFCLTQRQLDALADAEYEVCIDSSLVPGSLSYGECYLPGETADEVLVSCHICHPSLANDNLAGVAVATFLGEILSRVSLRCSYRLVFIPGTIGSLTWLSRNEANLHRIKAGLVALTKADLVETDWLELVREDVASAVRGTFLEGAPIVPVSSVTGEGLDELRQALDAMVAAAPPPEQGGRPRQFVDRVFSIRGAGTVVTGTLAGGPLRVGQEVEVTLPIADLRVLQAGPLIRQWANRFGEQPQALHENGNLPPLGPHHFARGFDDVAQIEQVCFRVSQPAIARIGGLNQVAA